MPGTAGDNDIVADYVIVGGGSAGAVLANRLTEDPDVKVMRIEASGEARDSIIQAQVVTEAVRRWLRQAVRFAANAARA